MAWRIIDAADPDHNPWRLADWCGALRLVHDQASTVEYPCAAVCAGVALLFRLADPVQAVRAIVRVVAMETITIAVDENVTQALRKLATLGGDLTPQMAQIAQFLSAETRLNFVNQASPLGVPWAITERKKLDPEASILRLKGDLSGSIAEDFGADFAAAGPEKSSGAGVYAAKHQFGFDGTVSVPAHERGEHQRKGVTVKAHKVKGFSFSLKTVARPYLGFNDRMKARVLEILAQPFLRLGAADGGAA
jgi:phage gpG-like protein